MGTAVPITSRPNKTNLEKYTHVEYKPFSRCRRRCFELCKYTCRWWSYAPIYICSVDRVVLCGRGTNYSWSWPPYTQPSWIFMRKISRARKLIKALWRSSLCCHLAHLSWQISPFSVLDVGQISGGVVRYSSVAAAELIKEDGRGTRWRRAV